MEPELAAPSPPTSLNRRLALVSVRERGVGPKQLRWIATDPEIFEAFYREHVEAIQRFVARRVGDRERAADLTAEIFLAAIGAAHRYRAERGAPEAWLFGIARTVVAIDRRRAGRERARSNSFAPASCSTRTTQRRSMHGSTPPANCASSTWRWTASPNLSGRFSNSSRSTN